MVFELPGLRPDLQAEVSALAGELGITEAELVNDLVHAALVLRRVGISSLREVPIERPPLVAAGPIDVAAIAEWHLRRAVFGPPSVTAAILQVLGDDSPRHRTAIDLEIRRRWPTLHLTKDTVRKVCDLMAARGAIARIGVGMYACVEDID